MARVSVHATIGCPRGHGQPHRLAADRWVSRDRGGALPRLAAGLKLAFRTCVVAQTMVALPALSNPACRSPAGPWSATGFRQDTPTGLEAVRIDSQQPRMGSTPQTPIASPRAPTTNCVSTISHAPAPIVTGRRHDPPTGLNADCIRWLRPVNVSQTGDRITPGVEPQLGVGPGADPRRPAPRLTGGLERRQYPRRQGTHVAALIHSELRWRDRRPGHFDV